MIIQGVCGGEQEINNIILNYLIECVNTEAKKKIQTEERIDGYITDRVAHLNTDGVKDFFFKSGKYIGAENFEIKLDEKLKWFLKSKNTTYHSESLYLRVYRKE